MTTAALWSIVFWLLLGLAILWSHDELAFLVDAVRAFA